MVAILELMGVMENWGLVTYTETFLLVDEKLSSYEMKLRQMQRVQFVTYYPISGFAFDAAHRIYPEWKLWDTFVHDVMLGSAFVKDAMISSHPIEVVVHHPDEADQIFNAFSYHNPSINTVTEDLWEALEKVGFPLVPH
ncbi:Puromycin-sensitive aminopeptidase and related aminopeptidases [Plasmopara halstedii]|uniref:Puromycin-sensitive aminopeptidase and related aminopeptidases n=1 Tax=Plasmopara halstedii TaxID=4781 RepID=A0A0P1B247_PLAHL|nr:Puromycin-sensitive aminopeptidase and related aminopeptidases [Plasmopara halstedii]CEG47927.1 Puromycin-sensitive aminopeptidase and related aminopeptidases [Plasmopara halstedii]|eukprot:XP_024584296.1 Puromycin-sensitive aminopeptidase and related aminopeptidases [Plasmopara halstedii]